MGRWPVGALVFALGALAGAAAQAAGSTVQLTEVTVDRPGDAVTVRITTSGAPKYTSEFMDGPFRLVLDFEDALYRWKATPVRVGADPVREIRGSQYRKGVARLVIELTRKVPYTIEAQAGGLRVQFGTSPPPAAASPASPPFTLRGIVLRDDGAVAYVAATGTGRVSAYRVGDALGDGVVEVIEERHVVLRTPRGPLEMRLEEPRPGPRPQP